MPIYAQTSSFQVLNRIPLYGRDECEELMKIIQSRVVDCSTVKMREDATQKGLYDRTIKNDIAFTGSWRSSSQLRGSPEAYPYSNCYLSTPSSGGSALQIRTPNLCNTAIEEAKKWLEEKKMELSPSSEHGRGLFSLSTDVLQHVSALHHFNLLNHFACFKLDFKR